MAWNINNAIKALIKNSSTSSQHQCAKYVRIAIEAGGVSTAGRPVAAKDYRSFLPRIGFSFIGSITGKSNQANWTKNNARPGDIAVMEHGQYGHICMFSGKQWISDFKQNNMWVYGGDGKCYIFRYDGVIDGTLGAYMDINSTGLKYNVPLDFQQDHKLMKSFGNAKYNLVNEIIEYLGDFNNPMNNDIQYENEITMDESSISESIVSSGMFWASDINNSIIDDIFNNSISIDDMKNVNIGPITSCGLSKAMVMMISKYETGHEYGYKMTNKDLNGYDLGDAHGHKTFGYGLLFHPTSKTYMDSIKKRWNQQELEQLYLLSLKKYSDKVRSWASSIKPNLNQNQIDAITCASYNFGIGFLNSPICKLIKMNPNDQRIYSIWCHYSDKQGKKYPGLITRRHTEAAWYFGKKN